MIIKVRDNVGRKNEDINLAFFYCSEIVDFVRKHDYALALFYYKVVVIEKCIYCSVTDKEKFDGTLAVRNFEKMEADSKKKGVN
jgi:hypothetical protein